MSYIDMTIRRELPELLADALNTQLDPQGGSATSTVTGVRWTIPKNENIIYSYQPKQKDTVPGYRKRDGTYVDSYERNAPPIEALIDPNIWGSMMGQAIQQAFYQLQFKF